MAEIYYIFNFINENEYRKKERTLRKYNMLAYKKLIFEYYPKLRNGEFVGEMIEETKEQDKYELDLPTNEIFKKVHGVIKVHYAVDKINKLIIFDTITPEAILTEGHRSELSTYKGVMVSKEHEEKDKFKIDLMNMLNK